MTIAHIPKLTNRQLYDYKDIDRWELFLIRCGHHLWHEMKRLRRLNGGYLPEEHYIWKALETVWAIKKQYRVELKAKTALANAAMNARFKRIKGTV